MASLPTAARKHHRLSALLARRAVREAHRARETRGIAAAATIVALHQITSARESESAVAEILTELAFTPRPEARLRLPSYATDPVTFARMADSVETNLEFDRLVASLVQEAGNAAEQIAVAVRPEVGWTRVLTPPSCSRCVALAGRVYRWSDGFLRHPQDDCVTMPVHDGDATYAADPVALLKAGQVSGLSKTDQQAILDGADFGQVVNVRRKAAGLTEAGTALARGGRPTPAGIYRLADGDRAQALEMLARYGYIT